MAMLKTIDAGSGKTDDIDGYLAFGPKRGDSYADALQRYLAGAGGTRAQAFACTDDLAAAGEFGWSDVMEGTRARFGKACPAAARKRGAGNERKRAGAPRAYYHFVISPDPEDHAGAEEVCELARCWCERCFPQEFGFQWVVSVHDDNESRVMHAHIVLNAVNAKVGRKVHISKRKSDAIARIAQELSRERGMGAMEDLRERRRRMARGDAEREPQEPTAMTVSERAMRDRGAKSWVAEIRDGIDESIRAAHDWAGFEDALFEGYGIRTEWSRRGLGFRHPDSTGSDMKVMGARLGSDYTEEGIQARIAPDFDEVLSHCPGERWGAERPLTAGEARAEEEAARKKPRPPAARTLAERIERELARPRRQVMVAIDAMIEALGTIDREGITSRCELARAVEAARKAADGAARRLSLYEAAFDSASEVLDRARGVQAAEAELARLPKGTWDRETRLRRNELARTVREGRDFCRRRLSGASSWLEGKGLDPGDERAAATELILALRERAEAEGRAVTAARSRLAKLEAAHATTESVFMGSPSASATHLRSRTARKVAYDRSRRKEAGCARVLMVCGAAAEEEAMRAHVRDLARERERAVERAVERVPEGERDGVQPKGGMRPQ